MWPCSERSVVPELVSGVPIVSTVLLLNGYDIDGTLTAGVVPQEPYIVITGRGPDEDDAYVETLRQNAQVFMRPASWPATSEGKGEFKSVIISVMGVTHFWENDPIQVDIIRADTSAQVTLVPATPQ